VYWRICSWAFAVTKFDEIFWGYQPLQMSVLNRRFEDHLGYHHRIVLEKSIYFQILDVTKFMCSVALNMGPTSGRTHIKTVFSFSPPAVFTPCHMLQHHHHNHHDAICSSDVSVTQLVYTSHFFTINRVLHNYQNNKSREDKSRERGDQGGWWHFSGYNGELCFVSCPCGNNFPVTWCTASILQPCSCLSGQGGNFLSIGLLVLHIWLLRIFFFWGFVSNFSYWKLANCDWVSWQNRQSCRIQYQ
jgi:hypothetical protein